MWIGVGLVVASLLAAFVYWALIITEGVYLGRWAVRWLYEWGADSYDEVKQYDRADEAFFLGRPLERRLRHVERPLILDVATGTGRLPLALLRRLNFQGCIVGLDYSYEMLREAWWKGGGYKSRLYLVWKDASSLPFVDGAFDAVTCLEALEFMPDPRRVLQEMVRVLKPGGTFLASNRIGRDAPFFLGRTWGRADFEEMLRAEGLTQVRTRTWQLDYSLVWAEHEDGRNPTRTPEVLSDVLRCPKCGDHPLQEGVSGLTCSACTAFYPREDGILRLEESLDPEKVGRGSWGDGL